MKIVKKEKKARPTKSFGASLGTASGSGDFVAMRSNPYILDIYDDDNDNDNDNDNEIRNNHKDGDDDNSNSSSSSSSNSSNNKNKNNKNNKNNYGRKIRHVPSLIYTPVKVSTRKSLGSEGVPNSYQKKRSVTDQEMDELNTSLGNLFYDDDDDDDDEDGDSNGDEEKGASTIQTERISEQRDEIEYYSLDEDGNPLGRIPRYHFDPKNGKKSTVLRSARSAKKTGFLTI